jgi:hypothetical protein
MNMPIEPGVTSEHPAQRFTRHLIQGVEYFQTQVWPEGDLYLTRFGLPFAAHLHPDNWFTASWFDSHRRRLRGTSTIYRTETRPMHGESLPLVVRYNRVGEDLPVDTITRDCYTHAEFNSPFEEVAAVMALRAARFGPQRQVIRTKRPLAIYVPPIRLHLWQTGRSESRMAIKQARLPEIVLDILRPYLLVYGWIKGVDAQDAAEQSSFGLPSREAFLAHTMNEVVGELEQAGFRVLDMKPAHIIIRLTPDGALLRRKDGRLVYALVDYELLERISEGPTGRSAA